MRVFPAGFWSVFVYHAIIVGTQERAGQLLKNVIVILINSQVSIYELPGLHSEMSGKPFNIFLGKKRTRSFATIRALETVRTGKFLLMEFQHNRIQILRRALFQFGKELFMLLLHTFGLLWQLFQNFFHWAKIRIYSVRLQKLFIMMGIKLILSSSHQILTMIAYQ